jgi:hypothetical protein
MRTDAHARSLSRGPQLFCRLRRSKPLHSVLPQDHRHDTRLLPLHSALHCIIQHSKPDFV